MIPQFLLIALGTLVSEDLACIATGALVAQHQIGFIEGTLACLTGIFAGDLLLFLAGRLAGDRRLLGRWIPEVKLQTASSWIEQRGLQVIVVSRFTPGLRLPTYVAAGLLRSGFWKFTGYFLLASALWTPLLVGGTAALGKQTLESSFAKDRTWAVPALVATMFAVRYGYGKLRDFASRRRFVGFWKRKIQWEFWPAWAVYLPLLPYLIYLAIRHRSPSVFTAANPGMFSGGLVGESKSEILGHLNKVPGAVAGFTVATTGTVVHVYDFPVVLKPDTGERGSGVVIARSAEELNAGLRNATGKLIVQRYVPGREYGVYYVRYPDEPRGRVLYITEKHFPKVTGDGRRTLMDLILADPRAVCMAGAYSRVAKQPLDSVPAAGAEVQLVEIGSHCRGAIFLDGSRLITSELTDAIDRISQSHPGFYLGRYDVRAPSAEALQRGEFRVIELNGVASEATHVYDPSVSLREAYRVMAKHWRTAFEIGSINRSRGAKPMTLAELARLCLTRTPAGSPEPISSSYSVAS